MVPELLNLMARLAARYMPDESGQVAVSLPALNPTQHALFTAASRLIPGGALPLGCSCTCKVLHVRTQMRILCVELGCCSLTCMHPPSD